jgi:hypothetical protein
LEAALLFAALLPIGSLAAEDESETITRFQDSHIVQLTPWKVVESSESMPLVAYPAFVGTGRLGVGLDAAGLQSLADPLEKHLKYHAKAFHMTQSDLYVLHDGMISRHLYEDEVNRFPEARLDSNTLARVNGIPYNFMPFGWLEHAFSYGGKKVSGTNLHSLASEWRREWDLHQGVVRTRYHLERRIPIEVEVFAPYGGESVYCKLTRRAVRGGRDDALEWSVSLPLRTRNGVSLFDEPGAVQVGRQTLLASITKASAYAPSEPYGLLYGIAADGAQASLARDGWKVSGSAPLSRESVICLRMDFIRLAGDGLNEAEKRREKLDAELSSFDARAYQGAWDQHVRDYASRWSNTADIEVVGGGAFEVQRRFLLHMSQYLCRNGNDYAFGGTLQFLLFHQNGWGACNFHDHHYIVDGLARNNIWDEAEANLFWMKRVMRPEGRPFPWMIRYDGQSGVPPQNDRAPMSDANRALLAMRLYELAGPGRDRLLREAAYPIVRTVADAGLRDWFYEREGKLFFRGVETDVMGEQARENDLATMLMYISVLRKAVEYSERLGVDSERRSAWQSVLSKWRPEVNEAGRYVPTLGAPARARAGCWLCISPYLTECQAYLDPKILQATSDYGQPKVFVNKPWIGFAAASSEIRLGRPNRAEQFFVDSLERRVHGPGYFEEVAPSGTYAVPPYASAHGSHLVAACEQVLLSDFWSPRIDIGPGLPATLRTRHLRFHHLRGRYGVLVSGESTPKRLAVTLHPTGEAITLRVVLSVPCALGTELRVSLNHRPVPYTFQGESVLVNVPLKPGEDSSITLEEDL